MRKIPEVVYMVRATWYYTWGDKIREYTSTKFMQSKLLAERRADRFRKQRWRSQNCTEVVILEYYKADGIVHP